VDRISLYIKPVDFHRNISHAKHHSLLKRDMDVENVMKVGVVIPPQAQNINILNGISV
jgi:hypothetical protein